MMLWDDAKPAADFDPIHFCDVVNGLPQDSGLVFLGRSIMNAIAYKPQASGLARICFFNGTFACSITPAACRTLLPLFLPLDGHIDHEIGSVLIERRRHFAAQSVEPPFFEPDWSLRSDCCLPLVGEAEADHELVTPLAANSWIRRPMDPQFGAITFCIFATISFGVA